MPATVRIIEDIQDVLDFLDSALYTRAEIYVLDASRDEREQSLSASPSNEELFGRRGDEAWGSEGVVGEERGANGAQEEGEECWVEDVGL